MWKIPLRSSCVHFSSRESAVYVHFCCTLKDRGYIVFFVNVFMIKWSLSLVWKLIIQVVFKQHESGEYWHGMGLDYRLTIISCIVEICNSPPHSFPGVQVARNLRQWFNWWIIMTCHLETLLTDIATASARQIDLQEAGNGQGEERGVVFQSAVCVYGYKSR